MCCAEEFPMEESMFFVSAQELVFGVAYGSMKETIWQLLLQYWMSKRVSGYYIDHVNV